MSVQIRTLSPDIGSLTTRVVITINRLMTQLAGRESHMNACQIQRVAEKAHLFLACDSDDRDDVMAMATLNVVHTLTGMQGHVDDVVVDEQCRQRGIGSLLMNGVIFYARRAGIVRLRLTSRSNREEANRLYPRLGFERHETNVYYLDLTIPATDEDVP